MRPNSSTKHVQTKFVQTKHNSTGSTTPQGEHGQGSRPGEHVQGAWSGEQRQGSRARGARPGKHEGQWSTDRGARPGEQGGQASCRLLEVQSNLRKQLKCESFVLISNRVPIRHRVCPCSLSVPHLV